MAESDLSTRLKSAFQAVGADIKTLLSQDGTLSNLTTTAKGNLVAAINELDAAIKAVDVKSVIDDEASDATHAWSAQKVASEITAKANTLKSELLGGAGEAFDTLKELADLINTNKSAIEALQSIAGNHVRFDQKQTLTTEQQTQARTNIGAASAAEVATVKATAKAAQTAAGKAQTTADTAVKNAAADTKAGNAATAAAKAQGDVDTLKTAVGDTTVDFAAIYAAAKA